MPHVKVGKEGTDHVIVEKKKKQFWFVFYSAVASIILLRIARACRPTRIIYHRFWVSLFPSRWDLRQFPSNFWWLGHFPSARGFTNSRRAQLIRSERDNPLLAEFQGRCRERFQQAKSSAESRFLCLVYRGGNVVAYRRRQSGCVYWLTGQLQTLVVGSQWKRGSGR